jgi:malate/lactate dehydrogenase
MNLETKTPEIAMFGVGRLGALLGQELIRRDACSKLFLVNRSQRRLDGVLLSLQVYGSFVGSSVKVQTFPGKLPSSVRVVVLAIKDNYDPRDLLKDERLPHGIESNVRTIGLRRDMPLVREVCQNIRRFDGIIVVLTNPVDVFCALVKEWVPNANVLGLGLSLDTARLAFSARMAGINCKNEDGLLGGIHIGHLVQLRSIWPNDSPLKKMSHESVGELIEDAGKIGPRIVRGLGFTLHDCAAVFANDVEKICRPQVGNGYLLASLPDQLGGSIGRALLPRRDSLMQMDIAALSKEEEQQIKSAGKIVNEIISCIKRYSYFRV